MLFTQDQVDIRNVAVDDLCKTDVALIRHQVEALGLYTCRLHGHPLQVIAGQLGKGRLLGFFSHGSDRRSAIDGLLSACDVGQPKMGQRQQPMVSWVTRDAQWRGTAGDIRV